MANVQDPVTLARIGNLENQIQSTQSPVNFMNYLNSAWNSAGITASTLGGVTPWTNGPGGACYAYYTLTTDGCIHMSFALFNLSSQGGNGAWIQINGTSLPSSARPKTNRYFPVMPDLYAGTSTLASTPGSVNPPGCLGCLDLNGNLHLVGMATSSKLIVADCSISLLY